MKTSPLRVAAAGLAAAALGGVALAAPSLAQDDPIVVDEPKAEAPPLNEPDVDDAPAAVESDDDLVDCEALLAELEGDWEPSAEEIAEINAETDALIAHLADNGVTIGVETDDELGIRFPAFDDTTDEATFELVEQFFEDRYNDEDFGDGLFVDEVFAGEDWEPSAEEIAEINAETDALIAHLADNGVTIGVETDDELGIRFPAFDDTTDEATFELVEQFFEDRYGDEDFGEAIFGDEGPDGDFGIIVGGDHEFGECEDEFAELFGDCEIEGSEEPAHLEGATAS